VTSVTVADTATVIKVTDLVQKIGPRTVLDGLNFTVARGECFGVSGAGGSGKSTLLHILAGIDRFSSGTVEVFGCNASKNEAFKRYTGLVTQERSLFQDLNAGENLDYIAVLKNAPRENIPGLARRLELEQILNTPVDTLEDGAYQCLALACALLNEPKLLIVDEPAYNIDRHSRQLIMKELSAFLSAGGTCVWGFGAGEPALLDRMTGVGRLEGGRMTVYPPEKVRRIWEENCAWSCDRLPESGEEET